MSDEVVPQGLLPALTTGRMPPGRTGADLVAWLAAAGGGCRHSFERLYHATSAVLFGIVLQIVRDRAEAEEVLQDVYVKVWHRCLDYDVHKGPALAWLACIARRAAIDHLRRRAARPKAAHCDDADGDPYAGLASAAAQPEEGAMRAGAVAAVQRGLGALPNDQRLSVTLAFYRGLTHEEIARDLGRPVGTVKSWVRRGLAAMRPSLLAHA